MTHPGVGRNCADLRAFEYTESFVKAMPDLKGTLISHTVNGNKVTTRVRGQGTFTGTIHSPQGDIPGTGKKLDLEHQAERVYDDAGKLVRVAFSYNMQAFMKQFGLG